MAVHVRKSHSPQLGGSQHSIQRVYAMDPSTPIHSPHHSVNSSTSSRTPLHALTIHEYRKQQNTPTREVDTPPGKTLRRRAAASALNELERTPSISRTPLSGSRPPYRPLHLSQSAHQLASHQPLPPSPPHYFPQAEVSLRSQSAEPRDLVFRYPSSTDAGHFKSEFTRKVSNFKPIKRLPNPPIALPAATGFGQTPLPPPPFAPVTSTHPRLLPLRTTSNSDTDNQPSSDAQTTPSTFSLSRFPQPPHLIDPSLSLPNDENVPPRLNSSFATTAPATPPATPAIIHYRGASFDLVNPHDSLLFHDIVTPSRDIDSTDYLPLRSSEEPLVYSEVSLSRFLMLNQF